jgi:Xaa-Pro aminopeptidase
MAEGTPKTFREGNIICFEPAIAAGNQAYFVEDTILITANGREILNPALPYSPDELERAIAKR